MASIGGEIRLSEDVTRWGAAEIARRIAARELTSVNVVEAHIRRIEAINGRLNALVVPMFAQARAAAKTADEIQQSGRSLGLLHGVPFTVKECFHVAGTPATIGIERFRRELSTEDAPLVARLKQAGGVLLGKTNVPQLMLFFETDNPVYGRTNNPWDEDRSCGGSTGGEAALIAACGSPLGLGTDLGGSIRQPAHSCGVQGFLPTPGRLTTEGMRWNLGNLEAVAVQPGVLARNVADLRLAMSVLCGPPPVEQKLEGLRIAMWLDDGYFTCSPAIRRVVTEAAAALRERGAVVEPIASPDAHETIRLFFGFLSADGGANFKELLGDSPRDWRIARLLRLSAVPGWMRPLMTRFARFRGKSRLAELLEHTGPLEPEGYRKLVVDKDRFVAEFIDRLGLGRFDAILCPPHSVPALFHGAGDRLPNAASYCFVMNLLGFPCGVVTAGRVRPGEESDRPPSRDPCDTAARQVEANSTGLPVGVQIAALPHRDDLVLTLLSALESDFRSQPDFPRLPPI